MHNGTCVHTTLSMVLPLSENDLAYIYYATTIQTFLINYSVKLARSFTEFQSENMGTFLGVGVKLNNMFWV